MLMARKPGTRPKPTHLRVIGGNAGRRPLNKDEPKAKTAKPRCPSWLCDEAKKHWRITIKKLHGVKLMTDLDVDALAMYCEAYADWREAQDEIREHGSIIVTPKGYPVPSPWLAIANKAFDKMYKLLAEFGLTPSSRTRVKVDRGGRPGGWDDV